MPLEASSAAGGVGGAWWTDGGGGMGGEGVTPGAGGGGTAPLVVGAAARWTGAGVPPWTLRVPGAGAVRRPASGAVSAGGAESGAPSGERRAGVELRGAGGMAAGPGAGTGAGFTGEGA
ncbi:hypothetical protein [Streptomyces melanogenes]|uniref:hypothetical protein n=1 Tax=Streptomyces melanogenes TaxID=67326 RepID=UPI003797B1B4